MAIALGPPILQKWLIFTLSLCKSGSGLFKEINKVWYKVQSGNKVGTDDNFAKPFFAGFAFAD